MAAKNPNVYKGAGYALISASCASVGKKESYAVLSRGRRVRVEGDILLEHVTAWLGNSISAIIEVRLHHVDGPNVHVRPIRIRGIGTRTGDVTVSGTAVD